MTAKYVVLIKPKIMLINHVHLLNYFIIAKNFIVIGYSQI
jgi:hypothetical protein